MYTFLMIMGLVGFVLQIFVFEKPDGNFGMILCMIEVALISGSGVRLCQVNKEFRNGLIKFIKILFRF